MRNKFLIAILPLLLLTLSCEQQPFYEAFNTVDNRKWIANHKAEFRVEVEDTITVYDFLVHIRTTTDYKYNNLYIKVGLIDPDKTLQEATLPIQMTNENGWLGKNSGTLVTTTYMPWAKQNFKKSGTYIFQVEQMMQDSVLNEITDVGLAIYESAEQ